MFPREERKVQVTKRTKTPKPRKLAPKYSGDLSKNFWRRVRSLYDGGDYATWKRLYGMGCRLQNLEGKVLKALNEAVAR